MQVKHSSSSLFSFLKSIEDASEISRILNSILDIFNAYLHNIRVIVPLFTFLDRLLGSGVIRKILEDPNSRFAEELLRLSKLEIARIKDYRKLVNSMDVFCQLVQVLIYSGQRHLKRSWVYKLWTIDEIIFLGERIRVDESFKSNVGVPVPQLEGGSERSLEQIIWMPFAVRRLQFDTRGKSRPSYDRPQRHKLGNGAAGSASDTQQVVRINERARSGAREKSSRIYVIESLTFSSNV